MKKQHFNKSCVYLALLVLMALSENNSLGQTQIISNVNVVDVKNGKLLKSRDVQIDGDRISKISKHQTNRRASSDTRIIPGNNGYLVPGFIDSHAHVGLGPVSLTFEDNKPLMVLNLEEGLPKMTANMLIEHGVTTARDPGGNTNVTVATKKAIDIGEMAGPELFVAGKILDTLAFENLTSIVHNRADIKKEITSQKVAGVDLIKFYTSLSPELLGVAIEEAHAAGLKTTAHLHTTSWTEAARLGIDNIVHIIPGNASYIAPELREAYHQAERMGTKAFYKWFELVDLDGPEIKEMISVLKKNNVSVDPTLVAFHAAFYGDLGTYQSNKKLSVMPASMIENWKTFFNFNLGWTKEDFKISHKAWAKVEKFTKMLHDSGIVLTAGTDANNPWIVPGDSFHTELELFVASGISNADVLKIATLNGAKILEIDDRVGSIEKGKEADLVLLKDNPLENIKATRSIEFVMSNGKLTSLK